MRFVFFFHLILPDPVFDKSEFKCYLLPTNGYDILYIKNILLIMTKYNKYAKMILIVMGQSKCFNLLFCLCKFSLKKHVWQNVSPKILVTFVAHPEGGVHYDCVVTLLHPPHNVQEGESATRNGLVSAATSFKELASSLAAHLTINWFTPGLVCRIEANQDWGEDVWLLQAPVQLTGHKRSLTEESRVTCYSSCLTPLSLLLSSTCWLTSHRSFLLYYSSCVTHSYLTPLASVSLRLCYSSFLNSSLSVLLSLTLSLTPCASLLLSYSSCLTHFYITPLSRVILSDSFLTHSISHLSLFYTGLLLLCQHSF